MSVEGEQPREERRLALGRGRDLAGEPHEHVPVQLLHQALELVQFGFREAGQVGVREFAEQNVHLPHATMPSAEQGAATAGVEIDAGQGGFGHADLLDASSKARRPDSGGGDEGYIEAKRALVRGNGALVPRPQPR